MAVGDLAFYYTLYLWLLQLFRSRNLKGGIRSLFDPRVNAMGRPPYCSSRMEVSYRGHPCLGLAAIFAGMLYNVQIIQKSSTRNIMHASIIVLELLAKLQWVID